MLNVECGMLNCAPGACGIIQCGMWNVECGVLNVECGMLNCAPMAHVELFNEELRMSTFNIQHSTLRPCRNHSTFHTQHSTFNIAALPQPFNIQHSTLNIQHCGPAATIQHSTFHIQHSNAKPSRLPSRHGTASPPGSECQRMGG